MAMTSKSFGVIDEGFLSAGKKFCYVVTDFLRTSPPTGANWTVQGSSNGTIGSMGVDVIVDPSSFDEGSWVVLQPPHAAYQILISRVGIVGDDNFRFLCNPASDYVGGSAGVEPTSPSSRSYLNYSGAIIPGNASAVMQMTADLSEPYGIAVYAHQWHFGGNPLATFAVFPLDFENSNGHPYVFYMGESTSAYEVGSLDYSPTISSSVAVPRGELPDASGFKPYLSTRLTNLLNNSSDNVGWKIGDDDATDTMYFADTNTRYGFKGTSQFIQWIHTRYYHPVTFNSRQNVVFGDVIIPWDGFTIPDTSPIVNYI